MSFRVELILLREGDTDQHNSLTEGAVDKPGTLTSECTETTAVISNDW